MSWKLTINVIFNSFPLIKNKNLIPFLCHFERSVAIQRLQTRYCERSEAIQRLQTVIANKVKQSNDFKPVIANKAWQSTDFKPVIANKVKQSTDFKPVIASEAMISKGLWRKNPENQTFQGVSGLFNARIDDAAG